MEFLKERDGGGLRPTKLLCGIVVVAVLFFGAFSIVPTGHTGVRVTLGKVSGIANEGLNFKIPLIQKVVKMDNRIIKADIETEAFSKDLQTVKTVLAVNYHVAFDKSNQLYQSVGTGYQDVILIPAVSESLKSICSRYTAEELVANRQQVSKEVGELLSLQVELHGLVLNAFNIMDFDFSEEYIKAIEQKQVAQQNALKAEQDLQRVKIEAEQQVTQAQADAETYRLQSQQLNENLIKKAWIDKWNGQLPQVQSGEGGSMVIDLRD
ncbi:MAG: prohibitin family protein [Clostridiales bacterium]|jgi:regulator of protease activity HflC (stomatin/prohibitin superfamily)|nr:prohibitin family protein [Clostridiales bacterium]